MLQRAQGGGAPVSLTIPDDAKSSTNGHGRKKYLHWMQRPENAARVRKTIRKMQRMAAAKRRKQKHKSAE